MSGNQLAKFFATVGFKTDLSEWDSAIAKIKKDVAGIATAIKVPKDVRTKTTQIVETINKVSGNKLTPVQRANQAIKAEDGFLEAAKIKSLKLITESNARSLIADAKLRSEKLANALKEKKSASKLVNTSEQLRLEKQKWSLVEKQSVFKLGEERNKIANIESKAVAQKMAADLKHKSEQAAFRLIEKKSALKLADANSRLSTIQKTIAAKAKDYQNKISYNDSLVNRMKATGNLDRIKTANRIKQDTSHAEKLQQSTANINAKKAWVAERGILADKQAVVQRLRNESKAIGTRVRESVGGGGNFSGGFMGNLDWKSVVAGGTLAGIAKQMYTVANFQAGQEPQYEFITGSKEKAGEQIKFINGLVDKLKLNLVDADASYKQFLGAVNSTIGAEKAQKTFESLTKFSVMMGTTEEQYKRGLKAVTQMLSKQKLSAEELECRLAA